MDIAALRQQADREAAVAPSTSFIPGSETQPHGCALVLYRADPTQVHAGETVPRLLSIDLPDAFGQPVSGLFGENWRTAFAASRHAAAGAGR